MGTLMFWWKELGGGELAKHKKHASGVCFFMSGGSGKAEHVWQVGSCVVLWTGKHIPYGMQFHVWREGLEWRTAEHHQHVHLGMLVVFRWKGMSQTQKHIPCGTHFHVWSEELGWGWWRTS